MPKGMPWVNKNFRGRVDRRSGVLGSVVLGLPDRPDLEFSLAENLVHDAMTPLAFRQVKIEKMRGCLARPRQEPTDGCGPLMVVQHNYILAELQPGARLFPHEAGEVVTVFRA